MPKAKVAKNYHVNIPKKIRQSLNIQPGDTLLFNIEGNKVFFFNGGKEKPLSKESFKDGQNCETYAQKLRRTWEEKEKWMGL